MSETMQVILAASLLIYLEETLEDILVYFGARCSNSLPRFLSPQWSTHPFYVELAKSHESFHPAQITGNPSLVYRPLPLLPTVSFAWQAIGAQFVALVVI